MNEERRMNDRRRGQGATMTPEVNEPVDSNRREESATTTTPQSQSREPVESQRTSRQMEYWPDMTQYRQRFDEIQGEFIEDPRQAVRKAEKLVEEAMERMTSSMRERIQSMHRDAESGDTEKLRMAMKSLRDFVESLGSRRAA